MKKGLGWVLVVWIGLACIMTLTNQIRAILASPASFSARGVILQVIEALPALVMGAGCVFIAKRYLLKRKQL